MNALSLSLVGAYSAVSMAILWAMDEAQPTPYMDEIFHVPQAQKYCRGKFSEWDDKITTLPGLYIVSIGVINPLAEWTGRLFCDTLHLRMINTVLSTVMMVVVVRMVAQIHGSKHFFDEAKAAVSALNVSMFPVLYFFSFMYYTDVGSTFMVLLMYCLHLNSRDWFASFIGLLAIGFRQTNVVWVAWVAVQSVGPHFIHAIRVAQIEQTTDGRRRQSSSGGGQATKPVVKFSLTTRGQTLEVLEGTYRIFVLEPRRGLALVPVALRVAGGYALSILLFVIFVACNGGVAVGDRTAHQATFHPTQALYFLAFSLGFGAPHLLTRGRVDGFVAFCFRKHRPLATALAVLAAFVIESYTFAHPYLLADNRHYTFYIWRRFVARTELSKFALLPVYGLAAFSAMDCLKNNDIVFKLSFPVFTFVSLSPQLLLEFRYFIIPYVIFRLHVWPHRWSSLAMEGLLFAAVNLITIYLYMKKPFVWPHEPDQVQRFIW